MTAAIVPSVDLGHDGCRERAGGALPPTREALGIWRSRAPVGAFPHIAGKLDAESAANDYEAEIEVEWLNIDATSYRQLRQSCAAEPDAMATAIRAIVSERGKLHNPATGSGGVLVGRLTRLGSLSWLDEQLVGQRVVPLASLIATPLSLESVGPVEPDNPQVPVVGRAIVTGRMSCAAVPDDLPLEAVLSALDVYPAASHTKALARLGAHVLVIGCGHAGLSAVAAARETVGANGLVTVIDTSEAALELACGIDPGVVAIAGDARDAVVLAEGFTARGLRPADLTLLCTTVEGCEGTAILLTAADGTVLFFSTATSFSAAALGADSLSSLASLTIPNGFTEDRGSYLLGLLRRKPSLLQVFSR
ncbi:MAG: L-erythro-3,5-diaminohexanoate dehydrogenase [Actinomycetota bacterium]|nr:L-erythro-3,5-diaminohexanoate dehydrogenase [Actinomycetota bacterium]